MDTVTRVLINLLFNVVVLAMVYVPTTRWLAVRNERTAEQLRRGLDRYSQEAAKLRQAYEKMKDAEEKKAWNIEYLKDEIEKLTDKKAANKALKVDLFGDDLDKLLGETKKQKAVIVDAKGGDVTPLINDAMINEIIERLKEKGVQVND